MQKRSFNYIRRTREDIIEQANASSGDFDDYVKAKYKKYKVRDGKNLIRILPPTWENPRHYGYEIWVNYGIGTDNQSYLSLAKMKGERDPIGEAYLEADREGNEKLAKALRAKKRFMMWVIDRQDEDASPMLWACPLSLNKDISTLSADEDTTECLMIDEPAEGYDIRFYKEGQGLKTEYPAAKIKLLGPTPLSEDEDKADKWLSYVAENPIPDCLNYYSYEHISKVFNGNVRMDDEQKTERPRAEEPKRSASGTLARAKEDDIDEGGVISSAPTKEAPTRKLRPVDTSEEEAFEDIGAAIKARLARTAQAGRRRPVTDDD